MGYIRKHLSADALHATIRSCFDQAKLKPLRSSSHSWSNCLMSGLAVFGFKFSSLLKFEQSQREPFIRRNLKNLYGIDQAPSDTCMRERLDQVSPKHIRAPFKKILAQLQRAKVLERYQILGGHYIMSVDGTGQYSSKKVNCNECCEKHHRNGEVSYYHHLLAGAIVHPDEKVVIPVAPEPITKQDGAKKNDCERNAAKRFFADFRREHPHLKILVVEDALAANYPHLSMLDSLKMPYIVGVKPGDHAYLFDWIKDSKAREYQKKDRHGTSHRFRINDNVPLNDTHEDYKVSVIEYWEQKLDKKEQHFSWVTGLTITEENVYDVMRAARARWKIENETFNTLKNQGYHFEHNYGHGNEHLCSTFSMLMLLSFLVDQTQQAVCQLYQKARERVKGLRTLHEQVRVLIQYAVFESWQDLLTSIGSRETHPPNIGRL